MNFGCHVSIREGYLGAAKTAYQLNANAFQYFPKNPRSLTIKEVNITDTDACKRFCQENNIQSVAHSPYPSNLTPSEEKRKMVVKSLVNDLAIADACGSIGVVVHFGTEYNPKEPLVAYQLMIEVINEVLEQSKSSSKLLLENNAGKPGSVGTTLEELVQVRKLTNAPERVGFCFDTCHAHASSIWNGDNWKDLVKQGELLGFFENLAVIHLNNSKYPVASGKDRHANIFGSGYIKENQWNKLLTSTVVQQVPLILETPSDLGITHEQELHQLISKYGK